MSDLLTVTGVVATDPHVRTTTGGIDMMSFRLASSQRRFDRSSQRWVDGETNWYTVSAFRHLAANAGRSLRKGDRVLVTGRLRIRKWEQAERSGFSVDLEAEAMGHDLAWGTSAFSRVRPATTEGAASGAPGSGIADGAETRTEEFPVSRPTDELVPF